MTLLVQDVNRFVEVAASRSGDTVGTRLAEQGSVFVQLLHDFLVVEGLHWGLVYGFHGAFGIDRPQEVVGFRHHASCLAHGSVCGRHSTVSVGFAVRAHDPLLHERLVDLHVDRESL